MVEPVYSNVVGQDSVSRFENKFKKKKKEESILQKRTPIKKTTKMNFFYLITILFSLTLFSCSESPSNIKAREFSNET